jgi:hypothetical protein
MPNVAQGLLPKYQVSNIKPLEKYISVNSYLFSTTIQHVGDKY